MNGSIANVVLLKELSEEDLAAEQLLEGVKGVMFGADVENCLVLVVPQLEVLLRAVEVLDQHVHIIVLQCVVKWQVAIEVFDIGSGADFVDDGVLLVDADDVLHSLTFEVLHTARLKELIVACEPVEDILITILGTDEKHILSQVVRLLKRLVLVLVAEDFEHLHVLGLHCSKERELSLKVRLQALLWAHLKQSAH